MTWKGKTRGGTFGYLFFIYLIRYLGITAAYTFLCFVVPYYIPFAPKATASIWFYSRNILKYGKLRSIGLLFRNYYRLGQILIDKVAINGGAGEKIPIQVRQLSEISGYPEQRPGGNHDRSTRRQLGNRSTLLCRLRQEDKHRNLRCRTPENKRNARKERNRKRI